MIKFNIKLIAIIVALLVHLPIMAYDLEIDGIYYDLDIVNKTVSVTSGNKKYSGDVIIPSTVTYSNQTLIVTDIGNSAFYECTGLKSIYIPNSIPKIGSKAFRGCSSLESITIPNSITEIASQTFYGCI